MVTPGGVSRKASADGDSSERGERQRVTKGTAHLGKKADGKNGAKALRRESRHSAFASSPYRQNLSHRPRLHSNPSVRRHPSHNSEAASGDRSPRAAGIEAGARGKGSGIDQVGLV